MKLWHFCDLGFAIGYLKRVDNLWGEFVKCKPVLLLLQHLVVAWMTYGYLTYFLTRWHHYSFFETDFFIFFENGPVEWNFLDFFKVFNFVDEISNLVFVFKICCNTFGFLDGFDSGLVLFKPDALGVGRLTLLLTVFFTCKTYFVKEFWSHW